MANVEEITRSIAKGDEQVRKAPTDAALEAVRALETRSVLSAIGRMVAILQGTAQDAPRAVELTVAVCERMETADTFYGAALHGSDSLDVLDIQMGTLTARESSTTAHRGVVQLNDKISRAVTHLMAAADILQECGTVYASAVSAVGSAAEAQPGILHASETYRTKLAA